MPKKTAHAPGGVQRSRTKQKSFELVRPLAEEKVLEVEESQTEGEDVVAEEQESVKVEAKSISTKSVPESAPVAVVAAEGASKSAKSVASRMAARRQAALKAQRAPANLITAENYGYVRRDLIFILILAVIMFSAIIIMHFVPAIGG